MGTRSWGFKEEKHHPLQLNEPTEGEFDEWGATKLGDAREKTPVPVCMAQERGYPSNTPMGAGTGVDKGMNTPVPTDPTTGDGVRSNMGCAGMSAGGGVDDMPALCGRRTP